MQYKLSVTVGRDSIVDFKSTFESEFVTNVNPADVKAEVKETVAPLWSLASLDPDTVQIVLAILSGSGALAAALPRVFSILEKYVESRNRTITVISGKRKLVLSGNISEKERKELIEKFIRECVKEEDR